MQLAEMLSQAKNAKHCQYFLQTSEKMRRNQVYFPLILSQRFNYKQVMQGTTNKEPKSQFTKDKYFLFLYFYSEEKGRIFETYNSSSRCLRYPIMHQYRILPIMHLCQRLPINHCGNNLNLIEHGFTWTYYMSPVMTHQTETNTKQRSLNHNLRVESLYESLTYAPQLLICHSTLSDC